MWIGNKTYEIQFGGRPYWIDFRGLLIKIPSNSGMICCGRMSFPYLMNFLKNEYPFESDMLKHNNIEPDDQRKLLAFFKGVKAYSEKDGSNLTQEDLDIIGENFVDTFLDHKLYVKKIYNYLTKEEK